MNPEETIKQELESKFGVLKDAVVIQRPRRIFVDVPIDHFAEVFDHIVKSMNFPILPAITGLDEGATFGVMYHLGRENGQMLSLRTHIPREKPLIKTVTDYFPSADIYERELVDLFGINVEGLAAGPHYPLPDNWPQGQHPLRKDWKEGGSHA